MCRRHGWFEMLGLSVYSFLVPVLNRTGLNDSFAAANASAFCSQTSPSQYMISNDQRANRANGTYFNSLLSDADFTTWAGQLNF